MPVCCVKVCSSRYNKPAKRVSGHAERIGFCSNFGASQKSSTNPVLGQSETAMHEAYEVQSLINTTVQIEAITAYDHNILLGTRQGHLLMYLLTDGNGNSKYDAQLLQYCKNFSKKPIQQIEVMPDDNLILCLTDNLLATYDINGVNFPLVKTLPQTKGASLFSLDYKSSIGASGVSESVARLCVAIRRKLHLFYGKNGEFKKGVYDFTVSDIPKVMAWGEQYLCVGFKGEYTLYDFTSGDPKELFPTSSSKSLEPTIAKYSDISFLLGRDNTSVLVEEALDTDVNKQNEGKKSDDIKKAFEIKDTIKWQDAPIAAVWDAPYVLGLLQDKIVVQTLAPATFIQTLLDLNKARLMYRCKQGLIYVASIGQVWCLSAVDVTKQRQQLLKDKHFKLAIDLTNLSDGTEEEKKQKIHSIQMLYAFDLFDNKQYSESMREFIKLKTDPADVIKLFPELNDPKEGKLTGKDLENALTALIEYLTGICPETLAQNNSDTPGKSIENEARSKHVAQQIELIETTLLKCYLQTNDAFVASLLRRNHCRLEEAEKMLLQYGKHSELIILYETKGQHTKALQLLKEQAAQPDSSLKGYQRTKNYLQRLGADHINLIFEFSDWILKEHPEEGLKIFTEDTPTVKQLPRAKVLDFFLREHDSMVIPYIEHVIHSWNDTSSIFHNALIRMYRDKIANKMTATDEEIEHTKSKLISFLESSKHYTPETVLLHFPNDSLFEERAIILGKLGRHEQALAIYVLILGDVPSAIKYCETVSLSPSKAAQDVYAILIRILINPLNESSLSGPLAKVPRHPATATPDLETALNILENNADKISPIKALTVLPDTVPLPRLKSFLQTALDEQLRLKRKTQVLKGLLYAEHLQVQEVKKSHESKIVVINDYNVCPVCMKRFGNQSAFVRYPTGEIVHYSCRYDK